MSEGGKDNKAVEGEPSELERLYSISTKLLSNPEACRGANGNVISNEILLSLLGQLKQAVRGGERYNDIIYQLPNVIKSDEEYGGYSVRSVFETIDVLEKEAKPAKSVPAYRLSGQIQA